MGKSCPCATVCAKATCTAGVTNLCKALLQPRQPVTQSWFPVWTVTPCSPLQQPWKSIFILPLKVGRNMILPRLGSPRGSNNRAALVLMCHSSFSFTHIYPFSYWGASPLRELGVHFQITKTTKDSELIIEKFIMQLFMHRWEMASVQRFSL